MSEAEHSQRGESTEAVSLVSGKASGASDIGIEGLARVSSVIVSPMNL